MPMNRPILPTLMARMANAIQQSFWTKLFLILTLSCTGHALAQHPVRGHDLKTKTSLIDTIYQFGDSVSDTGNWKIEDPEGLCTTFPYGETFFHHATGRCSDGLIMADFYAKAFGLEFLEPYLKKDADFRDGVNFAVGGAAALDAVYLESMGANLTGDTNSTLSVQFDWFKEYLNSTCHADCKTKLRTSLILMEDIGGDDYCILFKNDFPYQAAYDLVPYVVRKITDVVHEMIIMGAVNVVVPSVFAIGCLPFYLTLSTPDLPHMYDDLGCVVSFNRLAEHHNTHLQTALKGLQLDYPHANIMYADYYHAIKSLIRNASSLGFEGDATLKTCCGHGNNPYNYNSSTQCGSLGVPVCPHPETRVIWDGIHFTQHFYMYLSNWMLEHTILPGLQRASSY